MGKIIWSERAKEERKNIIKYWNTNNGNNAYSQKLNEETKKMIAIIKENPYLGSEIDFFENIRRILIFSNYSLFYTIIEDDIYILSFWDNRQNPDGLEL